MVTKAQALTCNEFHHGECKKRVGPRGGISVKSELWRRNGRTKTWKTRPNDFRVPIKFGLYEYSYLEQSNAIHFHTAEDCPLNKEV